MTETFKKRFKHIIDNPPNVKDILPSEMDDYTIIKKTTQNKPLFLFGCGIEGIEVAFNLQQLHIPLGGVCDNFRRGVFPFTGHSILTPKELYKKSPNSLVIISSKKHETEMINTLLTIGFHTQQIIKHPQKTLIFPEQYGTRGSCTVDSFINDHYDGYEWVFNMLSDETSYKVLLDSISKLIFCSKVPPTSESLPYFDDELISLLQGEVFVDAGAWCGDTSLMFIKQCRKKGIQYNHIFAFEADQNLCEVALSELSPYKNIDVISKGLWDKEMMLSFITCYRSVTSTFVLDRIGSKEFAPVTSLDNFFISQPKNKWPTFIKMDIEGAEYEALKGSENVISAMHPKLAICAYHKPEDPYLLIKTLLGYNKDYKFYLRQYGYGYNGQVLYAV